MPPGRGRDLSQQSPRDTEMNSSGKGHDAVFEQSKQRHMLTAGILSALRNNLEPELAFSIAAEGFTRYMIAYYTGVLEGTAAGSQERFDRFRGHYEEYAGKSTYIQIIESTETRLKVRYDRCPFNEVMEDTGLSYFSQAFCMSDPSFTAAVLPGVEFSREHVIARGDPYCDHTWTFNSKLEHQEDTI